MDVEGEGDTYEGRKGCALRKWKKGIQKEKEEGGYKTIQNGCRRMKAGEGPQKEDEGILKRGGGK